MKLFRGIMALIFLTHVVFACAQGSPAPLPKKKENVEEADGLADADEDEFEADDSENNSNKDDDEKKSSNNDGKVSAEDDDDLEENSEDFGALLTPSKLKSCHDEGKLFDRKAQLDSDSETAIEQCHVATYPSSYNCDRAGIEEQFGNGTAIVDYLDNVLNDCGYKIDQCGDRGGLPFVFFTMVGRGDKGADCGTAGVACGTADAPALCYRQLTGKEN